MVLEERLHEKQVVRMMRQVLQGVAFLHDRNIVHLDVKVSAKHVPNNEYKHAPKRIPQSIDKVKALRALPLLNS